MTIPYSIVHVDHLSEQDLHALTSVLRKAAPEWLTIGRALGLTNAKLTRIHRKPLLSQEGYVGYFREMLRVWLRKAYYKGFRLTITALEGAIRGSGYEDLANNFRPLFLQQEGRLQHVCIMKHVWI